MKRKLRLFFIIGIVAICFACENSGCGDLGGDDIEPTPPPILTPTPTPSESDHQVVLPPANAAFDYQIGGAYTPPAGVTVVTRDRNDALSPGLYNICYINGFQVQPDEAGIWPEDLILRDQNGRPVIDDGWDEMLLDIRTAEKRQRIAAIVGGWIEGCAADGFDAVEIDNLDSWTRSGRRITTQQAVAYMALLSPIAHQNHLAIAQKNATQLLSYQGQMGTDFAVAEECNRYNECNAYIDVYRNHVLMIEYRKQDFNAGCSVHGDTHSIVLRDLYLRKPGSNGYVYDGC